MSSLSLANFTARNSKYLKYPEVQLLGGVVGLSFLKDTFIIEPLGKGFENNDAFRVKNIATGGDASATDAAASLNINVIDDNLSLAIDTNSKLLDSTALGNALISARMTKVMKYFHTDSGAVFGNDVAGNTLSNGNKLRLALNFVSPPDADAFDDSVAVQIMPANTLASIVDKDGNPLIWATSKWEKIVNGIASGTAAAPWAVAIVASGTAAAVNLESTNSYSDLDEYTKCALAVSLIMMAKKPVKLVGAFNQSNNANIVKAAGYHNATWNTTTNQLEPTSMANVESSDILKVAQSFTGYSQAKWSDIDGITGLTTACKIKFEEQLKDYFTSSATTPFANSDYTSFVDPLLKTKVVGLSTIQFGAYKIKGNADAIAFAYGLLNVFRGASVQQVERMLSSFNSSNSNYDYTDRNGVVQTSSSISVKALGKKLASGASPSGDYPFTDDHDLNVVRHSEAEGYALTGSNFQSNILGTAPTATANFIRNIFYNYLKGDEVELNRLVDAVAATRLNVSRDAVALELAQNLNSGGATSAYSFNSRSNRFSSLNTKQTLITMILKSHNDVNGNDGLADKNIVDNLVKHGLIKTGTKSTQIDSATAQDAEVGLYSCLEGVIGDNTHTKDTIKINDNDANGIVRTFGDKAPIIKKVVDYLQEALGFNSVIAVQAKWSSMALANGANYFAPDDMVVNLRNLFPNREEQLLVGEWRSEVSTAQTVNGNKHNFTPTLPIHMDKLNTTVANRKLNKETHWICMSELPDVIAAGTTRSLVARNASKLTDDSARVLFSALHEKNGTFIAAADADVVAANKTARIISEMMTANATNKLADVNIDTSLQAPVSTALAHLWNSTSTTYPSAASSANQCPRLTIAQFISGTNNTFANMVSSITPQGSSQIRAYADEHAPILGNPTFDVKSFVSDINNSFDPTAVLTYYVAYQVGDEEITTLEANSLLALGVQKSSITKAATTKFGLLANGRDLSVSPIVAFLFNQNKLNELNQ